MRSRVLVGMLVPMALTICASGIAALSHMRGALEEVQDHALRTRAVAVERTLREGEAGVRGVERMLRSDVFVSARPLRGVVAVAASGAPDIAAPDEAAADARAWLLARGRAPGGFDADVGGRPVRAFLVAGRKGGVQVCAFESLEELDDELSQTSSGAILGLGVGLVLAFGGAWLASRWIAAPLRGIADGVRAAESGVRPIAIPDAGTGDEIDDLAEAVRRSFERLDAAAQRESEFASQAAHELRTPLATTLAVAETTLRRERDAAEYRSALETVRGVAASMNADVEALLRIARPASDGAAQRCDVVGVAQTVSAEFRPRLEEMEASLSVDAPERAAAAIDTASLTIALRNLVRNALEHCGRGVRVRIVVRNDGATVRADVIDDGGGRPPERLAGVRGPGPDADRSARTGFGLGVPITRRIVESFGGELTLVPSPAGLTATIVIPAADGGPRPGTA